MYDKLLSLMFAFLGSAFGYFFGGWNAWLEFLTLLILADYVTGLIASIVEAKKGLPDAGLSSKRGFIGLAKKAFMLIIIVIAHRADIVLDMSIFMMGTIWFYISNELISITENAGRIGFLVPPQIKQIIAILKNRQLNNDTGDKESDSK
ncbi:phage holin family protein [Paenibacillus sp. CMAA1739]|uniref:phage holin family protein n=1 Tax=Paenibacillus ottowii TaxID=2315729 RepID=UPI002DB8F98A|nr:phage holin family protein [Paenibacillus sp. CMAA1739]MEC4565308.1 phage holin family protein [Paenibacillus sp. CMAA1739]